MSDIVIFKEKDLIRHQWVTVLQENLPSHSIISIDPNDFDLPVQQAFVPHLIIIDLAPNTNPLPIINYYQRQNVHVAVWISEINNEKLQQLFRLNLQGYLIKHMELSDIKMAIHMILNGEKYIHPKLSSVLLNDYVRVTNDGAKRPKGLLTKREWEILELIVKGQHTSEIGDKLFISSKTVANHITSILRKLNVPNRVSAALLAVKNRWIIL